jgi:diguanylate cyclase (GGDEF)-like protein/PAS domain S-box-containing protein
MNTLQNRRILLVDDMAAIHEDFRKILQPGEAFPPALAATEAALFGAPSQPVPTAFELDSAYQGQEALAKVQAALRAGQPYAMAFVDMRMPPGWDGVQTIERLWQADPRLQVVICTAFSDHSWEEVLRRLETNDRLLVLKKPFDAIEVRQLADALTTKWQMTQQAVAQMEVLEEAVRERTLEITQTSQALQGAYAALQESELRYRTLVEMSPDAILIEQEGRVVFANSAAVRLFGAARPQDMLGRAMPTLLGRSDGAEAAMAAGELTEGAGPGTIEEQARRLDGGTVDVAVTRLPFSHDGRPATQVVARDISESRRLHVQLEHLATHDPLTGLPNRVLLMDRLSQALAQARRNGKQFMVALIDLDRFKWVNDRFGHAAGDSLLRTMSKRISESLRKSDTVARIGGDEFVVLLHDSRSMEDAVRVLNRIVACVSEPLVSGDGHDITISCSAGCSTYPEDGQDADELLRAADAAMYQAKASGRNSLQVFNADLRSRAASRANLEADLGHAIERGEFLLHYQPQVNLRTGAIVGVEALLRWQHPAHGNIPPGRFIPVAEECGLIVPIGEWVLQRACQQSREWQDAGLPPVRIAVNISAKQLNRPGLLEVLTRSLEAAQIDPACLELELTESTSMDDPEKTIPLLHKLKDVGVSLAIDDFGTGYSNMQYLTRLPIDKLKLDGSFVREITSNAGHFAISEAITVMAHHLKLKVVAEMAESAGQVVLLNSFGCDQVQGYYFAKPMPADACAALLRGGAMALPPGLGHAPEAHTLLVVDDEVEITSAVSQALRNTGYEVLVANQVDQAFEMMARHSVGVVLCDQSLPGTSGVEFLSTVRRLYPKTARLIFSEQNDFDVAIAAINQSAVHQFLPKPWNDKALRDALAMAFEQGAHGST